MMTAWLAALADSGMPLDELQEILDLHNECSMEQAALDRAARGDDPPPERRTAAQRWTWQRGALQVYEGTYEEARAVIEAAWGHLPRKAVALRMLTEWFSLDRATLLIATSPTSPGQVRALRLRREGVASVALLTPVVDVDEDQTTDAVNAWLRQAGYTKATGFVPAWQWDHPRMVRLRERAGWRVVKEHHFREPFIEVERGVTP